MQPYKNTVVFYWEKNGGVITLADEVERLKYGITAREREIKRLHGYIDDIIDEQTQLFKIIGALIVYSLGVGQLRFTVPVESLFKIAEEYTTDIRLNEGNYEINILKKESDINERT